MEPFTRLTGIAAPLIRDNVDTDAIIPSRESSSVERTGYGAKLFSNWRYRPGTREENPDFILNKPSYRKAVILVAGRNFGCGSSREAATWSLVQFGLRCVIAPSFGNIFRNNAVRNGLLTAAIDEQYLADLAPQLEKAGAEVEVDLHKCQIVAPDGKVIPFNIAARDRDMLLEGLNEIEFALSRRADIEGFREKDRQLRPWIYGRADGV